MLGWEYPPDITGGLGKACQGLAEAVVYEGVRVRFALPWITGRETPDRVELIGMKEVERRRSFGAYAGAGHYGHALWDDVARFAEFAASDLAGLDFDMIHAHDWMAATAAFRLRDLVHKPVLFHVHSTEWDRSAGHPDEKIAQFERRAIEKADRVVAVSHYTKRVIRQRYDFPSVEVVPNGSGGAISPVHDHPREDLIVFAGRLSRQKGAHQLIEAFSKLPSGSRETRLAIAGDGDERPSLEERVRRLGLERVVEFSGFLSEPELSRVLQRARLFVMPSLSEPFGLVALEAVAQGVPVLLSKFSGAIEYLTGAWQFDPNDTTELARLIVLCLSSPEISRRIVSETQGALRRLTWEQSARLVAGVYQRVLGERCDRNCDAKPLAPGFRPSRQSVSHHGWI